MNKHERIKFKTRASRRLLFEPTSSDWDAFTRWTDGQTLARSVRSDCPLPFGGGVAIIILI